MIEVFTLNNLVAFATLCILEIVLGIDNIVFISLLTNNLPEKHRAKARTLGIVLALVFRIVMLLGITWIIGLTEPLISLFDFNFSGRDLVLISGGLFLLSKSTTEIHKKTSLDMEDLKKSKVKKGQTMIMAILQIALLDVVFSFDSILTAIGMTQELWIMISAIVVSLIVMLVFAGRIAAFIEKRVSLQILALSFLILIGVLLIAEGFGQHVPKTYIYVAVGYSLIVEILNMRADKRKLLLNQENKN